MSEFTNEELNQIALHGSSIEKVNEQITRFNKGFPFINLERAATVGDGILKLNDSQLSELANFYKDTSTGLDIVKFVPASGAASRMFKDLYAYLESDAVEPNDAARTFLDNLDNFAFADVLKASIGLAKSGKDIVKALLSIEGLNYGKLPKGLLQFHKYGNRTRTPMEEHFVEGASYARGNGDKVQLHFTVSPEHASIFKQLADKIQPLLEQKFGVKYEISYSQQEPGTDTIGVDLNNGAFKEQDGTLVFRPAGHGALLDNLNKIEADIVFLKNIDNVVPDRLKGDGTISKKALAGILLQYQAKIFKALDGLIEDDKIEEAESLLTGELNIELPPTYISWDPFVKKDFLEEKLNRPLRVCGMVVNTGEPGGGPFHCTDQDGAVSLQIVETAQINPVDIEQRKIVTQATHFNPVDVVCGLKNITGGKFDLAQYIDHNTGLISIKSKSGRELKAQELPGLWNGSMANWNTVFVEVPAITFNPVKTVLDLLRPEHQ